MREIEPPFELTMGDIKIAVSEHSIKGSRVFHLVFSDSKKPLNITIATKDDGQKFWTSTPEGRQSEAEQMGKLVANYIRTKNRRT